MRACEVEEAGGAGRAGGCVIVPLRKEEEVFLGAWISQVREFVRSWWFSWVLGFVGLRFRGFVGSWVQGFEGSKVRGFKDS